MNTPDKDDCQGYSHMLGVSTFRVGEISKSVQNDD